MKDPSAIAIPDALGQFARRYWGEAGDAWIRELPAQISEALERFEVRLRQVLSGSSTAYVAEVTRGDGSQAVLKVSHPFVHGEADALFTYNGQGAIYCYAARFGALLLERCLPGRALRHERAETALEVALDLAARLGAHRAPESIPPLVSHAADLLSFDEALLAQRPSLRHTVLADGVAALRALVDAPETDGPHLLHGDLHPGNIISAEREPWLAIDPKPLRGDLAYEPIPLIVEVPLPEGDEAARRELKARVELAAHRLGVPPARVAAWGLARRSDWALFCHRSGDRRGAARATDEATWFFELVGKAL